MGTLEWSAAAALTALLGGALFVVMWRSPQLRGRIGYALGALVLGAVLVVPVRFAQGALERWAEIDPVTGSGGQVTLLLYAFLVVAPLETVMVVAAMAPFWRLRRLRLRAGLSRAREIKEGVAFAGAAAFGFVSARNFAGLVENEGGWLGVLRAAASASAFLLLSAGWGYVLGRNAVRGFRGRRFSSALLGATVFTAVCDQLAFRRGVGALLAMAPVLLSMLVVVLVLWRDLDSHDPESSGGTRASLFASAPAPSLDAIRDAFRRQDHPITLRWISFGALVTTGMVTTGLILAVLLGNEVGLDFSAVDRQSATAEAMAPVLLLGFGALAAFPSSGYLLARASGTRSVLEPAIASALAMVLVMVFMGMLAPASVVFAIAFAPIAFALSCAGAWIGMS